MHSGNSLPFKGYGHGPLRLVYAQHVCGFVCGCVGVRGDACYYGGSNHLLLTYCVRMAALLNPTVSE